MLFVLHRTTDRTGISGVGPVAEGVEFSDGTVALRWAGDHPSTCIWPSLAEVLAVHGHGGDTVVIPRGQHIRGTGDQPL